MRLYRRELPVEGLFFNFNFVFILRERWERFMDLQHSLKVNTYKTKIGEVFSVVTEVRRDAEHFEFSSDGLFLFACLFFIF